ncbi:hypothetical protein KSF78_0008043 [Schistosoma japonicum]|nr:hypothetical protein KSF78_0008043 [Schistosoma japonicum]
MYNQKK